MLKGDNAVTRWPTKEKRIDFSILLFLSGKRDSNSRPQPWQGCALPTELFPQNTLAKPIRFGTANIGVKNNIPKFLMKKYEKPQTTGLQT